MASSPKENLIEFEMMFTVMTIFKKQKNKTLRKFN